MTQTAPLTLPAEPLEPLERLSLRDQLQDRWRETVEKITTLAVRFHSIEPDPEVPYDDEGATLAERLTWLRLGLQEIELAMRRMDVGKYGGCEQCHRSMSYDELTARPQRRRCALCAGD